MCAAILLLANCGSDSKTVDAVPEPSPELAASVRADRLARVTKIAECLRERGISVKVISDPAPGITAENVADPVEYEKQQQSCEKQLVDSGQVPANQPADDAFYARYYEYYLKVSACLRKLGLDIADPPAKDVFVESKGAAWNPYEAYTPAAVGQARYDELQESCPSSFA